MADADLLTLPLDGLHRALGGRMVPFAGYAMPVQFAEGVMAEHLWTREHAGLFDVSHMGQLTVAGEGAAAWLESLMPGDFLGLAENALRYSLLLTDAGGIIDDLMVTRRADDFYLVVNGATKAGDIAHMQARLPAGVTLTPRPDLALLALQGPAAAAVLEAMLPGVAALKFMRSGGFDWRGVPLWVSRSGYTGEDGFEISVPAGSVEALAQALLAHSEVKPIGLGARDSLRLEAGLPLYGHDLSPETTPVEAGLSFAISKRRKAEGGFPGAAPVLDQLFNGAPRKRIGLRFEGKQPVREGAAIFAGDAPVGVVTSGGFAPSVGAPVAMGYVESAHAADGTALAVEVRGRRLPATAAPMPFWQKNYVR
ncbi:glycine cleavage system aminomethyltransferase GcvT [Sandaracinobacteroides saxicola]|uniref:aminomethyltransferase n=1 Tax=Sandaracinobacteroides saxicola TaxID=2759707 RepID=A0A7G5IKY3_9SPHN|nr:glycine cleavage system aminomethyltransferase GcvT [Sandaracinobacteroides saxicola]QMW24025.1 glycine cleavage system aminomethyltransferase GcvT [Sandaracinobacteroides saxicola]